MILLIDNYDSFTYNLVDYFNQLGEECKVIQNDEPVNASAFENCKATVLSPGPGMPDQAGNLMRWIPACENRLPLLGICLGHQALCQYYGGSIAHAIKPMHGKISKVHHIDDNLFHQIPEYFNVVRYHSLICQQMPDHLQLLAYTEENEPMAFKHRSMPIWGLQFHPEAALTEHGFKILSNWISGIEGSN